MVWLKYGSLHAIIKKIKYDFHKFDLVTDDLKQKFIGQISHHQ